MSGFPQRLREERKRVGLTLPTRSAAGRHLQRWSDALNDSWVGDLIGAVALFTILFCGLFAALVFGG